MSGNLVHFQSHTLARQNETWMCRDTAYVGKAPPTSKLIIQYFIDRLKESKFLGAFDEICVLI